MNTMLSRSGRSNPDGKLVAKLDIPVSEQLNEAVIIAAAAKGVPKAELVRDILNEALVNGCWLPLTPWAHKALSVLTELDGIKPGDFLAKIVNDALCERFSIRRSFIQDTVSGQSDESRGNIG